MSAEFVLPPRFQALASQYPGLTPCRVTAQERGLYRVISANAEQAAEVSGRFQHGALTASDYPAVGDYVMAETETGGSAIIHELLHRKSVFMRRAAGTSKTEQVVAANIDTVFLCMSLNNDFNLRRLERYLTAAWDSGATPVAVLTKSDLCDDLPAKLAQVEGIAVGADVVVTSSVADGGLSQLMPYISEGKTVAFVGSSGVGKSTLINTLLGENRFETNGLRNDDKGRHTTTHRELITLKNGAVVIDTPGMRELGMWDAEAGLDKTFSDIAELMTRCRYRNCTHSGEKGCAVGAALMSGELSGDRWQSYLKLTAENAYAADAQSYAAAKEKKFKEIAKYNKTNKKR